MDLMMKILAMVVFLFLFGVEAFGSFSSSSSDSRLHTQRAASSSSRLHLLLVVPILLLRFHREFEILFSRVFRSYFAFPPILSPNRCSFTITFALRSRHSPPMIIDSKMPVNLRCGICFRDFVLIILLASVASLSSRSSANAYLEKERTLAIVKPDGVSGNYTSSIRKIILESGFSIQREFTVHLDEDGVRRFYAEHSTKSFFPSLTKYMTSGPVLIMILQKVNAVADWRALIGPTDARKAKMTHPNSIRAMCGEDLERNCVHGSDSVESAAREISFFFKEAFPEGTTLEHDEL
ncbi:hypothetical protein L6452_33364 [Arctium lappa]|uniref:Uncharacterized protein n=1 Tax=Arctium lappa TaxID=4217 RepID=A0ACB8YJF8_ARCLA|nr:hypothetical protein L6452_33364 [Arctium lappa]